LSLGTELESWLLAWVCFMHSVQLSPGACPIFLESTEWKISLAHDWLLQGMQYNIRCLCCRLCVRLCVFPPFVHSQQTRGLEGQGTRLNSRPKLHVHSSLQSCLSECPYVYCRSSFVYHSTKP